MKTSTSIEKAGHKGSPTITGVILAGIMLISIIATAQSGSGGVSGSGGGKLTFKNPTLKSGTAGANGAVYKFADVGNNVDALLKIKSRSDNYVYLVNIDMTSSGFDKAWQPQIGYDKQRRSLLKQWYMEFEMSFVQKGTNIPATIDEFNISAIDVDGNGANIKEYVEFGGLNSYKVEATSLLTITKITGLVNGLLRSTGARFDGASKTYNNIDTGRTDVMVTANYLKTQLFTVRLGATAKNSSASDERMYSMYFQDFKYTQPAQATLPVKLKSFDASVRNSKVELDWSTSEEVNFSHFILQRSANGHDFSDVSMIMSNSHALDYSYGYSESFRENAPAVLYYRLKMVDIDGTFKYSAIRIVKLNTASNSQVSVSTYPNPVTSELRITIPSNWQNKEVVYDVVNLNGNVIKRQVAAHAGQTETMQVGSIKAGVYLVRLKAGRESATQQIVKK